MLKVALGGPRLQQLMSFRTVLMPQPLRRWLNDISFNVAAVAERPVLAAGIAGVAAAWADIEIALGLLLAVVPHTEARTGVSMYLALRGSAAQDAALEAAATTWLPKDLQLEFTSLLHTVRRRGKERNRVVHALWGTIPQLPDALINCQPENLVRDVANAYDPYLMLKEKHEPSRGFVQDLLTYDSRDFLDIITRLIETSSDIEKLIRKVSEAHVRRIALARALMLPLPIDEAAARSKEFQTNAEEHE
jgi:hypothetical protein